MYLGLLTAKRCIWCNKDDDSRSVTVDAYELGVWEGKILLRIFKERKDGRSEGKQEQSRTTKTVWKRTNNTMYKIAG